MMVTGTSSKTFAQPAPAIEVSAHEMWLMFGFICLPVVYRYLPPIIMEVKKMGPSSISYLSNTAIFHFHDYGRKSISLENLKILLGIFCWFTSTTPNTLARRICNKSRMPRSYESTGSVQGDPKMCGKIQRFLTSIQEFEDLKSCGEFFGLVSRISFFSTMRLHVGESYTFNEKSTKGRIKRKRIKKRPVMLEAHSRKLTKRQMKTDIYMYE